MENASKALIIAGAILISILLIGIGVALINALNNPMSTTEQTMNSQEIQMFNAQFEKYRGKQSGSNVASLMSTVSASNAAQTNAGVTGRTVTVKGAGADTTLAAADNATKVSNALKSSHTYTVTMEYGTTGYISKITVTY